MGRRFLRENSEPLFRLGELPQTAAGHGTVGQPLLFPDLRLTRRSVVFRPIGEEKSKDRKGWGARRHLVFRP